MKGRANRIVDEVVREDTASIDGAPADLVLVDVDSLPPPWPKPAARRVVPEVAEEDEVDVPRL